MIDFGTVRPGTTLYVPFHTFDSNDPSASVTITGLAVTDIEIYKNGSVTQRASDTGYSLLDTDGIDFDGVTGIHGFSINLSSNATSGFFTAGGQFWVVVSSVTVDAATVNFVAATFRIGYSDAILNTTIATLASQTSFTLSAGSADNSAYVGCPVFIHDIASAVQVAAGVVSAYTGSTKTVTLAADPGIFTMAAGDNISLFMPANTRWAGTTLWGSGAITAGSIASNAITATKIASAAITSAKFGSGAITSTVLADAAITAAKVTGNPSVNMAAVSGDTTAADNLEAAFDGTGSVTISANLDGSVGSVTGAINTAAGTITTLDGLDTAQDSQHSATQSAISTVDGNVDSILVDTAEIGAAGAGLSAVPWNASWDAQVQSEVTDALNAYDPPTKTEMDSGFSGLNDPTAAEIRAEIDSNSTQLAAIVADTNELQSDDIPGTLSTIDSEVGAIKAVTDNLPDSGALTSLATAAALTTVDGNVDAILVDTAEIGAAGAGLTAVPWNSSWDTEVQSEVTDALNAYDPPTNAEMEARTLASGPLAQLTQNLDNSLTGTASGTPTTTTMVSDIGVSVDDQFKGRTVIFDDDTSTAALQNQATDITACTASSNTLTFTALTTAPSSGDTFVIV